MIIVRLLPPPERLYFLKRNNYNGDMACHKKITGFTLAEVLITLGIIGIVATIIIPTVIGVTKDKQYKTARYKALSTIGTASKNIVALGNMNDAQNAKDFVNNVLSSQISIAKTCENDKLENCGISKKIKTINNDNIDMPIFSTKQDNMVQKVEFPQCTRNSAY